MGRYSFLVGLFHPQHHAGFGRRFRTGLSFKFFALEEGEVRKGTGLSFKFFARFARSVDHLAGL